MDYRYFPEPDLKILQINRSDLPTIESLGQLPNNKRQQYIDMGLSHQIANTFVSQANIGTFFDTVITNS